ncbi:MAG TPA: serine hydrolase [Xanthobacteraceae bacterium]|nr:serine hydrolase [Xanthobacteraceae bacterium]
MVPLGALALTAGAGLALTTLDVCPVRAEALLLVDVDSGKVISEQNATYPWYPASVTKLMTTYVTFKAVRDHRINLESVFTVSPNAVAQQPSKMGFKVGTRVTVDNALKMLLVHSANDMAVVLAEGVSGSIEKFTEEMNAEARHLGMTQTNYVNPNGLPADEQVTSARDLAILARALILEFPEYDYYWHIASIRLGRRTFPNTNRLIDAFAGTDGMKTGFICASGFNLVATATRGGKRLIAVVLGAKSSTGRIVKAAQLFERGFGTDPLTWLVPSQGAVDTLEPVAATPPDMHEEVCANNRRRRATEDDDEGGEAGTASAEAVNGEPSMSPLWSLRGAALLTSGLAAGIPPVEVYTGPARNNVTSNQAAVPAAKKRTLAVAAKPPAAKLPPPRAAKPATATAVAHPSPATAAGTKPSSGKPLPGSDRAATAAAGPKTKPALKPAQVAPKTGPQ